jgi:hypothetical protein
LPSLFLRIPFAGDPFLLAALLSGGGFLPPDFLPLRGDLLLPMLEACESNKVSTQTATLLIR